LLRCVSRAALNEWGTGFLERGDARGLHPAGQQANPCSEELGSSAAGSGRQMGRERRERYQLEQRDKQRSQPTSSPALGSARSGSSPGCCAFGRGPGNTRLCRALGGPRCVISKAFVNKEGGKKHPAQHPRRSNRERGACAEAGPAVGLARVCANSAVLCLGFFF